MPPKSWIILLMKQKILFISHQNNYSGSIRVLLSEIQDKYCDCEYKVITTGKEGFLKVLEPNVIYLNRLNLKGRIGYYVSCIIYSIVLFMTTLYWGRKYNVIYINTIMPFQAAIAGLILSKQIVYHVHEKFISKNTIIKIAEKVFFNIEAKKIYVSHYLKNTYKDYNPHNIVVHNKLSKEFIKNIKYTPIENRDLNSIYIISAKVSKDKGIDIFYRLAKQCPIHKFFLVTEESLDVIEKFFNYDLLPNLFICDGKVNVAQYYQKADIVINLTNPLLCVETFGMTLLEAMSYGIPIVAPNFGGPRELIHDGENGFLINDIEDIDLISKRINFILDKKNYTYFSNNSIRKFREINQGSKFERI